MSGYLSFNVNAFVRVKLTEYGRELLRQRTDKANHFMVERGSDYRFEYDEVNEDADGWSEWQLWELMQNFGEFMYNGAVHMPFEADIRIVMKNPIDGKRFEVVSST